MRLKTGFKLLLLIGLILLGLIGYSYYQKVNNTIDYSKETINKLKDLNILDEVKNKKYSKTLEKIINDKNFDKKYLSEYVKIKYVDKEDFIKNVNTFLDKGYSSKEINNIYKYLSDKNIEKLLNKDYIDLSDYYNIKNLDIDKIDRYNNYKETISLEDKVTRVNLNLDLKPYEVTKEISDPNDYLVIVNKFNYLKDGYKPEDLVSLKGFYGDVSVRKEVYDNFINLQNDAKKDGITLVPTTAFRDANFQKTLYTNYVNKDGVEAADTYSARPGFSEHQTGLAIDLRDPNNNSGSRLTKKDYEWLKSNSSKYGFIIRFPHNKENITLYQEENWHIRYVGKEHAKKIMDNDLTLEEYVDLYITEY